MDITVYLASARGHKKLYHLNDGTGEDGCSRLNTANQRKPVREWDLKDAQAFGYTLCDYCADRDGQRTVQCKSLRNYIMADGDKPHFLD